MKKQLKMLAILMPIAFGILNFANLKSFHLASATYVEGPITQDTIWTLVDSPFVIFKDVIVYPNATLTIEPGVEVKFGGVFSLIVSGKLHADGTNKTIMFTSNKEQPAAGDWNAIVFNGMEKSTLTGCFIAYAKYGVFIQNGDVEIESSTIRVSENGITVVNGKLRIQNCNVSFCYQNGINITNSESIVQNSAITENQGNGICITGNRQVIVQSTTIIANGNGMLLTGNDVSNVNIAQNIISASTQNGICIDADNHANIAIVNNIVSSNARGFYISTPVSTRITNNSISYNKIGILYDEGSHTANYNDIYGNEKGVDVLFDATVNAEYNYWDDPSGPYHESLNPNGKGDPVGGDGVNLDFIFFLTKSIGSINAPPTASLLTDKVWVRTDEIVMFFATNSNDTDGRVDRYFFDFGDGSNSGWTTLSIFIHKYSFPWNYSAKLRVMDDNGTVSNVVTATMYVNAALPPLHVNLELSNSTAHEGEQINVTVYVTDGTTAVADATVTLFSLIGGEFTESSGQTDASGRFNTTFTAPEIAEKANVRIVATASKNGNGYTDGSDYEYLEVLQDMGIIEPGELAVQVTAESNVTISEAQLNVTVYVMEYDMNPVEGASVTVEASSGSFSTTTGLTDSEGKVTFTFTAPQVNEQTSVTVTANATMTGYDEGQSQVVITVNPRTFNIQIIIAPTVESGKPASVTVLVKCSEDATSVDGATVTMQSSYGSFPVAIKTTDSTGTCTFTFNAPQTTTELSVIIIANATKNGYRNGASQTTILVTAPQAEGWPLTTILLIIIPLVIAVVVAILIKLKIIVISSREEE